MGYRSNPLAASAAMQNSQNIADAISGLGSPFSPANTMQMGLLQAKQREIDANIDLGKRELELKTPVYASQATQNLAGAGAQSALKGKYEAETKSIVRQQGAQDGLGSAVSAAYNLPTPVGQAIQQVAIASNDSNSKQMGDMIANLGRLNPQTGNPGESIFWAPGDWRMPKPAVDEAPESLVPQTQTPFNQGGGFGSTAAPTASTPLGTALQSGPRTVGNVTTIPGTASKSGGPTSATSQRLIDEASKLGNSAYSVSREADRLNNPAALANARNPVGNVPLLGTLVNWTGQAFGTQGAADRRAVEDFKVNDFLNKTAQLKGSITEQEGAVLRSGQPGSNAAAPVVSNWLTNVGYYSKMEADWQAANQEALQAGAPRPIPTEWKKKYMVESPPPAMTFKGGTPPASTPLANEVSGAAAAPAGLSPTEQAELAALRAKHKK